MADSNLPNGPDHNISKPCKSRYTRSSEKPLVSLLIDYSPPKELPARLFKNSMIYAYNTSTLKSLSVISERNSSSLYGKAMIYAHLMAAVRSKKHYAKMALRLVSFWTIGAFSKLTRLGDIGDCVSI